MRFENQVAIVTGASRGIGRGIALKLASEGAHVACLATTKQNAQSTVDLILGSGGKATAYACNVGETASIEDTFGAIEAELGVASILVNNAGITRDTLVLRMKEEDWDAVLNVNLKGSFWCAKTVCKSMMKARYGRIINLSSVIGQSGAAGQVNYAASKAGVIGLTMALAKEFGSRNITVNAVAPGFIETDMTSELSDEMKESVTKTAPIARLGTAEDIAEAVAYLASPGAGYVTGQVLTVDGGLIL